MTLDICAVTIPANHNHSTKNANVNSLFAAGGKSLHLWKQHPNLHGWLAGLYWSKGGDDPLFNGSPVELTLEDIEALERAVIDRKLPHTAGHGMGNSSGRHRKHDMEFIAKARDEIAKGYTVVVFSWW